MIAVIAGFVLIAAGGGALGWFVPRAYARRSLVKYVLLSFVVALSGAVLLLLKAGGCLESRSGSAAYRERCFAAAQGDALGRVIAARKPAKKVLVLCEPGTEATPRAKAFQNAMKKAAPDVEFSVLAFRKGKIKQGKKVVEAWTAREFDYVLSRQDVGGVVSLVGLPRDTMAYWRASRSKRPFLMLGLVKPKSVPNLANRVYNGDILTVIAEKKDADFRCAAPEDPEEAFKLRYLLVSKENAVEFQDRL